MRATETEVTKTQATETHDTKMHKSRMHKNYMYVYLHCAKSKYSPKFCTLKLVTQWHIKLTEIFAKYLF